MSSARAQEDVSCAAPHIQDGALVGTQSLLQESPNVTQPTTVNKPVPTPSIYKDARGEIHNVLAGNKRINILFSKQGVMRSGDIHTNTQHDFVFEGQVEVWTLAQDGSTTKEIYGAYEYIRVPPFVPHIFHFIEDTTMAEWWEPEPFQAWFYIPYRKLVDELFSGPLQESRLISDLSESSLHKHIAAYLLSEYEHDSFASIATMTVHGLPKDQNP